MHATASSDIPELLRQNGIVPDVNAVSLVYAANPNLQHMTFSTETTLNIPALETASGVQASGPIKLRVDYDLKGSLLANSSGLKSVVDQNQLSPALSPAARTNLIQASHKLSALTSSLNAASASRAFLEQSVDDSIFLNRVATSPTTTAADSLQLSQTLNDISAKFSWLTGASSPVLDPWVKVRAISSVNGKQVAGLTVCYRKQVEEPDKCAKTFEALTSANTTTDHRLAVCDGYVLWLMDYIGRRLSADKNLSVSGDVDNFELAVVP